MKAIHGNSFSIGMSGGEVHIRVRTNSPFYDDKGCELGQDTVDETVIIMSPGAFMGFKQMIDDAIDNGKKQ